MPFLLTHQMGSQNDCRRKSGQEEFVTIGGDRATDIPFEVYLKDWPG